MDKTRFLRALEQERFVFFIRPRRFGKTCWLSLLESYYSRTEAGDFEAVFAGTDIGRVPTPNRSRYVVLRFNFSAFNDAPETLERNFENYCHLQLLYTLEACPESFPESVVHRICSQATINDKLNALFLHSGRAQIPLYVLIDEYDNFANTILAHQGADAYHAFTHGGEMLGFTEAEVRDLLSTYRDLGVFDQDPDAALDTMREWYDGYRFAKTAPNVVYNTDMVLYYLSYSLPNKPGPDKPPAQHRRPGAGAPRSRCAARK